MLKHRNIVILFLLILVTLLLLGRQQQIHWSIYVLVFLLFLGIEFYGAYFIHSNFHLPAICKAETREQVIALSFDDGPVEQTEKVLEVLDSFNAKATFFCIGNRIQGKESILKKISEQGHLIGNHSYSHSFLFDLKNTKALMQDIEKCTTEIEKATGKTPLFFRPPYGVTTPGLGRAVKRLGLTAIGWNIRSLDTSIQDQQQVLARIKKRLKPGSILLLHDSVKDSQLLLKEILTYLKEKNYKVVPLDQLIKKQAYA